MKTKKNDIEKFLSIFDELIYESIKDSLQKKYSKSSNLKKILEKLKEAFLYLSSKESETKVRIKIRRTLMMISDLKYEDEVEDELLQKAVKLLKYKVIPEREKEEFANCFSRRIYSDWREMDEETIDEILSNLEGAIRVIAARPVIPAKAGIHIKNIITLLLYWSMYSSGDEKFADLKNLFYNLFHTFNENEKVEKPLTELSEFIIEELDIRKCMLKAFAGLFLGDLILSAVGKGLGIKEKLSLTEFIIFIVLKIIEKEYFKDLDRSKAREIENKLKSVGDTPLDRLKV